MTVLPNPANLYLTVTQVAERYTVSTDSVWRWARHGDFPKGVKIGANATRWCLADLTEHEATFKTGLVLELLFAPDFDRVDNSASCFGMVA